MPRIRGIGITVLLTAASASMSAFLLQQVLNAIADPPTRIEAAVALLVYGIGLVTTLWYLGTGLVALACLIVQTSGKTWHRGESLVLRRGAPLARRIITACTGGAIAVSTALAPAIAADSHTPPEADTPVATDLGWGWQSTSSWVQATPVPTETDAGSLEPPRVPPQEYTVRPGDSLWSIATEHASAGSVEQISQAWPQWYQANTATIGSDPDLIHPGQVLSIPSIETPEGS